MNWHIILNPNAGGGKAKKEWSNIKKELEKKAISYDVSFTNAPKEAAVLTQKAIAEGARNIISVGGDGTLNEVLNGIMLQKIVPTQEITLVEMAFGTGNDWIKSHNIRKGYKHILALISEKNNIQSHDVGVLEYSQNGEIRKHYFINITGFAFEGVVAKSIDGFRKKLDLGAFTYVMAVVFSLFKYKDFPMEIKIDEQATIKDSFFNICAGNGKYFGGGMKMLPQASFNNGLFEISLVKKISRLKVLLNVAGLFSGKYIKNKEVSIHRGKQLKISSSQPIWAEAEGEIIAEAKEFTVKILPQKVKVISAVLLP